MNPYLPQLAWRKSSHSNEQGGDCVELAGTWRKSSRSSEQGGTCVELAINWSKSSHSNEQGGSCIELASVWRKSSHSGESGGTCVEVAPGRAVPSERLILVRDSKNPEGPVLSFAGMAWGSFARDLKHGRYDSVPNN